VLKAAISSALGRQATVTVQAPSQPPIERSRSSEGESGEAIGLLTRDVTMVNSRFACPRCTFLNHPSLPNCELCGTPLISAKNTEHEFKNGIGRSESPGPMLEDGVSGIDHNTECVKFSFRAGGDKTFHERLKGAMQQRKWLLHNAPPVPKPDFPVGGGLGRHSQLGWPTLDRPKSVGIAGLERRGQELRKSNEMILGDAFEDLEALMGSAKEIVALAESFKDKSAGGSPEANALLQESATALGMITTKDMLSSNPSSEALYLSELSRDLAEYLTDDARGILRNEGGIMSLVDLWAVFNRARGGVELISPLDFEKAARFWEKLNLPVRLRQFKNGLLVVQKYDWTDDKTIAQLLNWFQELHTTPPSGELSWDWEAFGRGVTPYETAQRFGWSMGVATEELEMAEEKGVLCREDGVEGVRFWENWIGQDEGYHVDKDVDLIARNLEDIGLL
jgi:ESCRT-II complex subunit VPS36